MQKIIPCLFLGLTLLFTGCTSYSKFSQSYTGISSATVASSPYVEHCQEPTLRRLPTNYDYNKLQQQLIQNGYFIAGQSFFNASEASERDALQFGKSMGACFVYFRQEYTGTRSGSYTREVPVKTVKSTYDGAIKDNHGKYKDFKGTVETVEYETQIIPYTEELYDYEALYVVKYYSGPFGLLFYGEAIAPEIGPEYDLKDVNNAASHEGLVIRVVISGGLAEKAGLKEGDVLISVNNNAIAKNASWSEICEYNANNQLVIMRNGKYYTMDIYLPRA